MMKVPPPRCPLCGLMLERSPSAVHVLRHRTLFCPVDLRYRGGGRMWVCVRCTVVFALPEDLHARL